MKKVILSIFTTVVFLLVLSCNDDEQATGTVVFGANYHVINCITEVDVYIDGEHIGQLENFTDSVPNCDLDYGIRKEIEIGTHSYKVEIRPDTGTGCTADVSGELDVKEGGCETVFVDFFNLEWN